MYLQKRSVQTERWFARHRREAALPSKDTIGQRKSTRAECFWPYEWTRSTASEQMYLQKRSVQTERWFARHRREAALPSKDTI